MPGPSIPLRPGDPRKDKPGFGRGNTSPIVVSTPSFSFGALPAQPQVPFAEPEPAAAPDTSVDDEAARQRRRRAVGRSPVGRTQATTGGFFAAKTLLGQ